MVQHLLIDWVFHIFSLRPIFLLSRDRLKACGVLAVSALYLDILGAKATLDQQNTNELFHPQDYIKLMIFINFLEGKIYCLPRTLRRVDLPAVGPAAKTSPASHDAGP
ncbi:hypothetical protein ACEWPM_003090 [Roseovarius sp. S4756]|uniref:hypothetical protein n=1 Tax=Roseovarius maritimus TaxID=3342637 RepID=UPI0037272D66